MKRFIVALLRRVSSSHPCASRTVSLASQTASARQVQASDAVAANQAPVQKYCVTCHNEKVKSGGLALTHAGSGAAQRSTPRPGNTSCARFGPARCRRSDGRGPTRRRCEAWSTWLETELDRAAFAHPNPGRPTLQRLNRAEYRNAIRDLLALEIDAASLLPTDIAGHGFDNNADALTLSPALTERYLGAAAKISQMALARPRGVPMPETFFVPTDRNQRSASATICRSGLAAAPRFAITFRSMASTCSSCGRKRVAPAAASRGSPRSRISSTSPR